LHEEWRDKPVDRGMSRAPLGAGIMLHRPRVVRLAVDTVGLEAGRPVPWAISAAVSLSGWLGTHRAAAIASIPEPRRGGPSSSRVYRSSAPSSVMPQVCVCTPPAATVLARVDDHPDVAVGSRWKPEPHPRCRPPPAPAANPRNDRRSVGGQSGSRMVTPSAGWEPAGCRRPRCSRPSRTRSADAAPRVANRAQGERQGPACRQGRGAPRGCRCAGGDWRSAAFSVPTAGGSHRCTCERGHRRRWLQRRPSGRSPQPSQPPVLHLQGATQPSTPSTSALEVHQRRTRQRPRTTPRALDRPPPRLPPPRERRMSEQHPRCLG
jgi:hypothetical protein